MKTFEKFQKSSTVYKIDEAQGFSSFVGKAMGFARKVKNIATTGSLNKPADSIKQIAAKAANRAKSAPNSPLNPNPMKGKLGASLRNNPQAKAKAIEARSVANNPSKPKQNTDSAPTPNPPNPSSRPTSSALATRPESKGVKQNPAVAKTKEFIKKKAPVVKQKVGDFVRKQVKNVASKSAYRTDDKGKDLDDKIEKTGKKDKQGRDEFKTRGRPTIGGIRAALQSKGARELGSKLNTVRKNLPTADDYRTGNEGSGFGFGGRFKGKSLKMIGGALGKDGKKFEKTKVVDRKGVGKGKSKKVIVRGRELDAEGNPIEKKKDTSFKGQAKDALRRAAGITDKKKVDKVEDKPKEDKVTTPGKPPSGDGGSKTPVPAKPKKPDGEGSAARKIEKKYPEKDPSQERATDTPQADQGDYLDPKTGRRITKKFPDSKVKPPRKPQPYSKTLGTKKPPKETPLLPGKVPAENKTDKQTPKEKEKGGELATVKGGDITKIKTPASKSKAPEKEKAIVPSSEKPESKSQNPKVEKINNLLNNPAATAGEKEAARNALKRIQKREDAKNKVLSNNNVKTKTETKTEPKKEETPKTEPKKEETPKKEPVRAKRRSVRSKEFKNEDGTFNQKAYDDAKGRVETKKGGGRPKKQKEAEPSERKSSPSLTGRAFDKKELLKTSKEKKAANKEAEKRTETAKKSGKIDDFTNEPIKDAPDTSKLVRDPKTGEQIANPTSKGSSSEDGTQLKGVKDDKLDARAKKIKRRRESRFNRTPADESDSETTRFGPPGPESAARKAADDVRKKDMVKSGRIGGRNRKSNPRGAALKAIDDLRKRDEQKKKDPNEEESKKNKKEEESMKESYSNWREEFLWEVDKKYPDKVKEIKPMSGKNTITINPEDQTAKYKRGY